MNAVKVTNYDKPAIPPEIAKKLKMNNNQKTDIIIEDSLTISDAGKKKAQEKKEELARMEREKEELMRQVENIRKQNEAQAESMNTTFKCLKIALRIMSGDKVPQGDHRYLSKNNPELYGRAILMKLNNNDPKKHKRLSEDEESSEGEDNSIESSTTASESSEEGSGEISSESIEVSVEGN